METGHRQLVSNRFDQLSEHLFPIYVLYELYIPPVVIDHFLPDKLSTYSNMSTKALVKRFTLYSKPSVMALRSQLINLTELPSNSVSFNHLLRDALAETHSNKRLNFVILNDRLICMCIPSLPHISSYAVSKHIVLSNRSKEVRFAGEMWCDESNCYRLNNSSGTYQPADGSIGRTVQLFNYLTPELAMHGVSRWIGERPSSMKHQIAEYIRNKLQTFIG